MKNTQIRRLYYHFQRRVLTTNNFVIVVAAVIAVSFVWGSVNVLKRNYNLQKEITAKQQQLKLVDLQAQTLKFQQMYYKSDEYKELAARRSLGLAYPGEKALILPPNSAKAKDADTKTASKVATTAPAPSNFQQWINFLFGKNQNLQP